MNPLYRELLDFGWLFAFCLAVIVLPWVANELYLTWQEAGSDESEGEE